MGGDPGFVSSFVRRMLSSTEKRVVFEWPAIVGVCLPLQCDNLVFIGRNERQITLVASIVPLPKLNVSCFAQKMMC